MKMMETSYESLYDERMERLREISKTDDDVLTLLYVRANVVPLRRMFSWAVPNGEALETIQKYSPNVCVRNRCWFRFMGEEVERQRRGYVGHLSNSQTKPMGTCWEDVTHRMRRKRRRLFVRSK